MENRKRILIVEDDTDLLDILSIDLQSHGYEVVTATDGKQALQSIYSQKMDLVVLDVMIPYMDGYHMAYEVTTKMGEAAPKILLITGRNVKQEKGVILLSGVHDVLQKPFNIKDLHEKIKQMVG